MEELKIRILSGEGTVGNYKTYTGKHTALALRVALTKERDKSDRWARAEKYLGLESDGTEIWRAITPDDLA